MIQQTECAETKIGLGDGLSLWLSSTQQLGAARYVVDEIFTKRRYDHPGFQIRPTDNVVDIGANMGIFTLWAARQANREWSMMWKLGAFMWICDSSPPGLTSDLR